MDDQPITIDQLLINYINNGKSIDMSSLPSLVAALPPDSKYNVFVSNTNKEGWTVVHRATMEKNLNVLKTVMEPLSKKERYMLMKLPDRSGQTCMHCAVVAHGEESLHYLLNSVAREMPFMWRFQLLAKTNNFEQTCIHLAAITDQTQKVESLLRFSPPEKIGQLLEMNNENGKTALDIARERDPSGMIECLRSKKEYSKDYIARHIAEPQGVPTVISGESSAANETLQNQPDNSNQLEIQELKQIVEKQAAEIRELQENVNCINKVLVQHGAKLSEKGDSKEKFGIAAKEEGAKMKRGELPEQEQSLTAVPASDEAGTTPELASASDLSFPKPNNKIEPKEDKWE